MEIKATGQANYFNRASADRVSDGDADDLRASSGGANTDTDAVKDSTASRVNQPPKPAEEVVQEGNTVQGRPADGRGTQVSLKI